MMCYDYVTAQFFSLNYCLAYNVETHSYTLDVIVIVPYEEAGIVPFLSE